ncbi:MAG: hypothetical protein LUF33_01490 [Clostridiales bacterium]|nr:hypothetical protein [Clostridiales bacterium]
MIEDIKLENGDTVKDSSGRLVKISGADALFQRALICIKVGLDSCIYDRSLGCRGGDVSLDDEKARGRAELIINEALVNCADTSAEVLDVSDTIRVKINIGNESREEEVTLGGNV